LVDFPFHFCLDVPMSKKKAVIFDRDGTLIVDKIYLNDPDLVQYPEGVFEALQLLRDHGYVFAVATNQSGIPRGIVEPKNLFETHRRIRAEFARYGVDFLDFYYAPYMTDSNHWMRKPNPGMLEVAAKNHSLDLSKSWMVGDKMSDVEAGHRAGCKSVFLTTTDNPSHQEGWRDPDVIANTLLEAAQRILSQT
jgi:D-glycero-D-manno-heptose 1,7-bisphosphate phosphatase